MRVKRCEVCHKSVSQNETIIVDDIVYCNECFKKTFEDKEQLNNKKVVQDPDPTVCFNCNFDNGKEDLKKLSVYPICPECEKAINSRVFPIWVKAFLAGLVVVIAIGFAWNLRYYNAYNHIRKANIEYSNGNYGNASNLMSMAVTEIPELDDIKVMHSYFRAMDLLAKDSCKEALSIFTECKQKVPTNLNIEQMIVQARIGSCYNEKNYKGFLDASIENLAMDSTQAFSWAGVASAYSCLYADTKNETFRNKTENCLLKAKMLDSTSVDLKDYINMIEYRVFSKRIISREEFKKQFPNGWVKI